MLYYFPKGETVRVALKCETLDETDLAKGLPYLKHAKQDAWCRFNYLANLKRVVNLRAERPEDKEKLRAALEFAMGLSALENVIDTDGIEGVPYFDKYLVKGLTYYGFQNVGMLYMTMARKCVLGDDCGVGKTLMTLGALAELKSNGVFDGHVLIVTPASVKYQWRSEIREKMKVGWMKDLVVVEGTAKEREAIYRSERSIFIMNYEQVLIDSAVIASTGFHQKIGALVLDEAGRVKNHDAKRTRALNMLFGNVGIKFLLTATPIENKLEDLYSLVNFVDSSVLVSRRLFEMMYCVYREIRLGRFGPKIRKLTGYRNLDDAKKKLTGVYLRRTVKMVGAQLPKFVVQIRIVDLMKEQRKLYDDEKVKSEGKGMFQIHRLMAICNDPEVLDGAQMERSAKVKELLDFMEELEPGEKVVVFSFYERFARILVRKLAKYNPLYICGSVPAKDREKMRNKFNRVDAYRVMVMTSAGEFGVDFPAAGTVVNMDLPDNPARLKQRCGRIRRLSSKHESVRVVNILARDTIEEKTVGRIFKKMELFTEFFNEDNPDLVSGGSFYAGMSDKEMRKLY